MQSRPVFDLPTRIFHWVFSVLFITAFVIGKTVDDESVVFTYHMLFGMTVSFAVILRIIWGLVGSKHARFSGFSFHPNKFIQYFRGILAKDKTVWAGHNPATSWAAVAMMLMALGLGTTGYLMTSGGDGEPFEDIHELLANGLLVTAGLHVLGVAVHMFRFRDCIAFSMVTGKKQNVSEAESISNSHGLAGALYVGLLVAFGLMLYNGFDTTTGKLNVLGQSLQLGEEYKKSEIGVDTIENLDESEDHNHEATEHNENEHE